MRPEINLLTLTLFLALATGSAWADDSPATTDEGNQASNIEGWEVDTQHEEDTTFGNQTYFGMGYAARQALSGGGSAAGASSASSSVLGGSKNSGPKRGK